MKSVSAIVNVSPSWHEIRCPVFIFTWSSDVHPERQGTITDRDGVAGGRDQMIVHRQTSRRFRIGVLARCSHRIFAMMSPIGSAPSLARVHVADECMDGLSGGTRGVPTTDGPEGTT